MGNDYLLAVNDTQLGIGLRLLYSEGVCGSVVVDTFGIGYEGEVEAIAFKIKVNTNEEKFKEILKKYKILTA